MSEVCYNAVGRRKKAIARIRLIPGEGSITVNRRPLDEDCGLAPLKMAVRLPLTLPIRISRFDVLATVNSGGTTGQAAPSATASPARWVNRT
jgi:small subunit ribosomal protein S9